jgi:hypothetical protein
MGFFKKIFKPVSKVLDKVIPNEIKPALPYLAAFAPFLAPGIMGSSVLQRAAMGGGLNIFGQLSQEGNEGDINLLSAGLGALSGAMTAPGSTTADFSAAGLREGPALIKTPGGQEFFQGFADSAQGTGVMASGQRFLGETLAKGSGIMSEGIKEGLFTKAGLKAAALPAATATGDLMFAQAKRDQDEYDRMMEEESESEADENARRAFAIRRSMEAYGATEDEILDAIYAAGYQKGGRVKYDVGGITQAVGKLENEAQDFARQISIDPDVTMEDIVEEFEIVFKRKPKDMDELKDFYKQKYDYKGPGDVKMKETIKEKMMVEAKDGGRINLREGGTLSQILLPPPDLSTRRPIFAPTLQQAQAVFPRLNQLEQGVNMAENKLTNIKDRLGNERMGGLLGIQPFGIQPAFSPFNMSRLPGSELDNRGKPMPQGMKEGGLMDLGGKEMDLRGGGFVPIGKKEKADDVPARLSKNEFVMTADAVRAAGGGSVNEGAKRMYKVMNDLEARA